jgi:hypothetical protein
VVYVSNSRIAKTFNRTISRRVKIPVFNTGVGAATEGVPDPHWQVVAVEIDPRWQIAPVQRTAGFQPHPAIVFKPNYPCYNVMHSSDSQWITPEFSQEMAPGLYTFRTTFDLSGLDPATAILHGGFAVDNHVEAIRLNGHDVPVPQHSEHGQWLGSRLFEIRRGFVEKINTLDFVVRNDPSKKPSSFHGDCLTALQVKLDGSAAVKSSE